MTNNAPQQEKRGVCVYIPKILNGASCICILNICTEQGIFKVTELVFQENRLVFVAENAYFEVLSKYLLRFP